MKKTHIIVNEKKHQSVMQTISGISNGITVSRIISSIRRSILEILVRGDYILLEMAPFDR